MKSLTNLRETKCGNLCQNLKIIPLSVPNGSFRNKLDEFGTIIRNETRLVAQGYNQEEVDKRIAFGQLRRFASRELQIAIDNFNEKNVLRKGGFGKVYKGVLSNNTKAAVK
ncbi:protein NSP-INTERACTING KINASE 1-like [Camellia sinensis]|uniref:protein NSP-INTERACTING KINASE 1-like n=1 Tax=Camellia sinensis TaxID=4442 RepID=UPI001036779F|nr:protein NSP-INTERACTING KINASE 1-like [Camellia sinensis]